ncbi:cubilin-like isoform X2 [Mytilus trossulus]
MLPRETCWLLWMLYLTTIYLTQTGGQDCRYIFNNSLLTTVSPGIFGTPGFGSRKYPVGRRCHYIFIGKPDERVEMKFTKFNVQGVAPLCQFDYLDIYAEVSDMTQPHIDTPLLGRFCGEGTDRLPNLIISTSNIIILDFYSDFDKADDGFEGRYRFINDSIYNFGQKKNLCDFVINSTEQRLGYIVSPTYPGMYPDNLHCSYTLVGKIGQRIRIKFLDFSLFQGGDYCPIDYVLIHDGGSSKGEVIGRFCGNYKDVVIYSSENYLSIIFRTQSGRIDSLNADNLEGDADFLYNRRGFNISFEFSDKFVKPAFSRAGGDHIQHIKGTACDVRISSKKRSFGTLTSPGYPSDVPPNVTCNYYLDGMRNRKVLEKVSISFKDFEVPGQMPYCYEGYLEVNLKGTLGVGAFDERFCGSLLPPNLTSEDSRMILTLDTHKSRSSRGFSSTYQFITDFGISGHSPEDGKCIFLYISRSYKEGTFNSPYYPQEYPDNTKCEYIFRPAVSERLLISFHAFDLGRTRGPCHSSDNILVDQHDLKGNYTRINTYCGTQFPGPIVGALGQEVRVVFNSRIGSRHAGFQAKFEFLNTRLRKCGENITSFGGGGLIKSPGSPEKYKSYSFCQWIIKASHRKNNILVIFEDFHVEGKEQEGAGCKNAVMRVYQDLHQPGKELCGKQENQFFLSIGEYLKLEFVTSSRALGAKGFKITWTEVHQTNPLTGSQTSSGKNGCRGFTCKITKYCIDESLKCNGLPNCGDSDRSDEEEGCPTIDPVTGQLGPQPGKFEVLHIAVGASISSFFCVILVVCGFYHRKRFRNNPKPPDNDQVEVRYVAASSSNNTADRLLAVDHAGENGSHKSSHISVHNTTPKLPNRTPNQVPKHIKNPSIEKISQCSSQSSFSPSLTSNQSPKIASIPRTSRTPRIQKVSIV